MLRQFSMTVDNKGMACTCQSNRAITSERLLSLWHRQSTTDHHLKSGADSPQRKILSSIQNIIFEYET